MLCISKKNFKFLGCADLTISTIILGALLAIGAIFNLAYVSAYYKWFSIYTLIFGTSCAAVLIQRHNVTLRMILLMMFCIEILLSSVCFFLFFQDMLRLHSDLDEYRKLLVIGYSIGVAIRVAILPFLGVVLCGGLKEQ